MQVVVFQAPLRSRPPVAGVEEGSPPGGVHSPFIVPVPLIFSKESAHFVPACTSHPDRGAPGLMVPHAQMPRRWSCWLAHLPHPDLASGGCCGFVWDPSSPSGRTPPWQRGAGARKWWWCYSNVETKVQHSSLHMAKCTHTINAGTLAPQSWDNLYRLVCPEL